MTPTSVPAAPTGAQTELDDGTAAPATSVDEGTVPPIHSGRPLDATVRRFMEPRLRHDFGSVRVHTGAYANDSARSLGARAYTTGADIVFARGEYAPQTIEGRSLIAHELTHVIQQRALPPGGKLIQKQDREQAGPEENPSYDEAVDHLRTFYQRQQVIVDTLARMRDSGLELFTSYSSGTMNPADPGLLDLMEVALAAVPMANALGETFRVLRNQRGFLRESLVALSAAGATQSSETRDLVPGGDEARARASLRAQTIQSLADIEVAQLAAWWSEEDIVREWLRDQRYAPADVDLLTRVRRNLGELPQAEEFAEAMRLARDQFELQLYRRFYFAGSGRAEIGVTIDEFTDRDSVGRERPSTLRLLGVPPAVRERIGDLNGWDAVLTNWTPSGPLTSRAQGRSLTLPHRPRQETVDRMRRELLMPDLARRVLATYRTLSNPLSPSAWLMLRDELRRMIDEAGVVVDPSRRVLRTPDGTHEPLIFQQALLEAGASEFELGAIVGTLSDGPVILRRPLRGQPYVDAR